MAENKRVLLTPACKMTWGKHTCCPYERPHSLHSINKKQRFAIFTPGEQFPIMTTAANHTIYTEQK